MENVTDQQPGAEAAPQVEVDPKETNHISKLNRENQRYREQLREAQKQLETYTAKEKAEMEQQGKYKELLDAKEKEVAELQKLAAEAAIYRADYEAKLEEVKKGMDKESIDLLNKLPDSLSVKEKLEWASRLGGKKAAPPAEPRPGAGAAESSVQVIEAFKKADLVGKARILAQNRQNSAIYQALIESN